MNEFEGWMKIINEYQEVQKLVRLNQNLYDQLCGSVYYLKKYADELDLPLKKREELNLMLERSESIMDSFNSTIARITADLLQQDNIHSSAEDDTEPEKKSFKGFILVPNKMHLYKNFNTNQK